MLNIASSYTPITYLILLMQCVWHVHNYHFSLEREGERERERERERAREREGVSSMYYHIASPILSFMGFALQITILHFSFLFQMLKDIYKIVNNILERIPELIDAAKRVSNIGNR